MARTSWHFRAALLVALLGAAGAGCKSPEVAAVEEKQSAHAEAMQRAREAYANRQFGAAVEAAQAAITHEPGSGEAQRLIAEAHREAGNDAAAILAFKRAAEILPDEKTSMQRELLALYRRAGHAQEALNLLRELAQKDELNEEELLELARQEMVHGTREAVHRALTRVHALSPDSREPQVVEAELMLQAGDEVGAARRMDEIIKDYGLSSARLLRARYFLRGGYPDFALRDVQALPPEERQASTVVTLEARILCALERCDAAEGVLQRALEKTPREPDLLAQLAELKLLAGRTTDAAALVDQALAVRPRFARALYVRGRAAEGQRDWPRALEDYGYALQADPGFAPALSRIWRVHHEEGNLSEAILNLEKLVLMGQASAEEKIDLAELYVRSRINPERGLKLVREALRRSPQNPEYLALQRELEKQLPKRKVKRSGPIIMRGGR